MVTFGHIGMRQNRDFRTSRAATLTLMKSLTIMLFIIIKEITLKAARYIHALFEEYKFVSSTESSATSLL